MPRKIWREVVLKKEYLRYGVCHLSIVGTVSAVPDCYSRGVNNAIHKLTLLMGPLWCLHSRSKHKKRILSSIITNHAPPNEKLANWLQWIHVSLWQRWLGTSASHAPQDFQPFLFPRNPWASYVHMEISIVTVWRLQENVVSREWVTGECVMRPYRWE